MGTKLSVERLTFDKPARYEIRVQGRIDENWSDRLEGMAIRSESPIGESAICSLEGELLDQAALAGVLRTLYELHLPVLLVRYLTPQPISDRKT